MTLAILDKQAGADSGWPVESEGARRIALVLEYDGRGYAGSQFQTRQPTVQGVVEQALLKLTGERIRVSMAGRTDAGAHASGQVASFTTRTELDAAVFVTGLNRFLPDDVAVKSASQVDKEFDPRRHAVRREYLYRIVNTATRSPLWRDRAFQVPGYLDVKLMQEAAQYIVGTHDFASFASTLEAGKISRRRVFATSVERDGEMVEIRIVANSYLPHQVRYIVGTLIRVGQARLTVSEFRQILADCRAGLAGPVVPAYGLYLNRIDYNDSLKED